MNYLYMKIPNLSYAKINPPALQDYKRTHHYMPSFDFSAISLDRFLGNDPVLFENRIVVHGEIAFLLFYKNKPSSFIALDEKEDGQVWQINQLQGAKSRKSYRFNTCFQWQAFFADLIKNQAFAGGLVRHITMPIRASNICDARSQAVDTTYDIVKSRLKMFFSSELGMFIADVNKLKQ